ncbi:hypothetical protein A2856_02190 [Candidatus Uhrbacteria bacterium RIFCSPHIGHO2_01_FULL_63_20]|uniref:Glucose-6-phosphate isomerase n=1 Tax=Candidatus Uhrbacteria bacterium RIFCSPHIGHO2_01_FULL_63_20 TaxID=1802385 RepID=A0A1F7TKI8_9BACT|nr:MAG: hypothetical protein A2856_02190 [Candidatus Uhrbacteria bacterium RIFCSPHIGHO2_01_FULL_63_20]
MNYLSYDDANMFSDACGALGAKRHELSDARERLEAAHARLEEIRRDGAQGFFDLPSDTKGIASALQAAQRAKKRFSTLLVIGIGGSDLAARTIVQALADREEGMQVRFLSVPDPEAVAPILADADLLKDAAVNVVSKSGSTLETVSLFLTVREALIRAVGMEKHRDQVFVTTDPADGPLNQMAKEERYEILDHPLNVGGRFSALSVVGLFPAACAGVDVKGLLEGAAWIEEKRRADKASSMPATFAALHALAMANHAQDIHVLMPYAAKLSHFAHWYRQIWAESLGKRKGNKHVGPTPVAALGPTDQHSQIQLYQDGPANKVVTFIEVAEFREELRVPKSGIPDAFSLMKGLDFADIMHAERAGTANALARARRPNGTLRIPSVSAESLGALFQFYMTATAYMGELMGVNAYDQPGVESGKQEAKLILEGLV